MQFINIKDHKTGDTVKALNFGGPKCYKVSNRHIWAPEGGASLTINENSITLEPLGLVINNPNMWTIVSHQNMGTANWRVTVKNLATGEEKAGVYPFNSQGRVYELECQPGTWVMASCGGYKIESSWSGQQSYEAYRLKGTGEVINKLSFELIPQSPDKVYTNYDLVLPRFVNTGGISNYHITVQSDADFAKNSGSRIYGGIPIYVEYPYGDFLLAIKTVDDVWVYFKTPEVVYIHTSVYGSPNLTISQTTYDYLIQYMHDNKDNIRRKFNSMQLQRAQTIYDSAIPYMHHRFSYIYGLSLNGIELLEDKHFNTSTLIYFYVTTELSIQKQFEIFKQMYPNAETVHKLPTGRYGL